MLFRFLGIFLSCLGLLSAEPACSRFHYEEQTLKKMIMVELLVDKLKTDLEGTIKTVNDVLAEIRTERAESRKEFEELQTTINKKMEQHVKEVHDIKDSVITNDILFSARGIKSTSPAKGEILVFKTIMTNNGSGYDNESGIFTAPIGGLYMFTLTLCISNTKYIFFEIVAENRPILRSLGIDDYDKWSACDSSSVAVILKAGGQVWVKTKRTNGGALWENTSENWNMFTGFLIHET